MEKSEKVLNDILDNFYVEKDKNNTNILIDSVDIESILQHKGKAIFGIVESAGDNSAFKAFEKMLYIIKQRKLVRKAQGLLIKFNINPNYSIKELSVGMDTIQTIMDVDADIIFGTEVDETLPIKYIKATVLITKVMPKSLAIAYFVKYRNVNSESLFFLDIE